MAGVSGCRHFDVDDAPGRTGPLLKSRDHVKVREDLTVGIDVAVSVLDDLRWKGPQDARRLGCGQRLPEHPSAGGEVQAIRFWRSGCGIEDKHGFAVPCERNRYVRRSDPGKVTRLGPIY